MKVSKFKLLFLLAFLIPVLAIDLTQSGSQAATSESTQAFAPEHLNFANLPLSFEANKGQANSKAKFISRGRGYTFLLTDDGADMSLQRTSVKNQRSKPGILSSTVNEQPVPSEPVTMRLLGARRTNVNGLDELPGKSNYFIGNDPAKWHVNIPTYTKVKYDDVYPGIDLVYYGNQQQLEYDFLVSPGADPRAIGLELKVGNSKRGVRIDANGDLVIHTTSGDVRWLKPVVYQPSSTVARQSVSARFVLLAKNRIGFKLGSYDKTRPLVIDPVLSFSSYLGGSASEIATDVAVDSLGNSYVAGPTCTGFSAGEGCNAIVTKINSTGTAVIYSSVFGGNEDDRANSVAVDAFGQAYVTGSTCSSDFPTTSGAFQTELAGGCDAFVAKLDVNGGKLYSTYLGGAEDPRVASGDDGNGIAVDSSGNAYVAGSTCTSKFPTKNGFRSSQDHCDGFAVKLNPAGGGSSDLLYSTLLGGDDGVDDASSIAVDSANNVYLAGITTGGDFPTTDGAFQTSSAGLSDAWVVKLDMTKSGSSSLRYGTYLSGRRSEAVFSLPSVAVDADGNIYVSGTTDSANFPTTEGAFQTERLPDTDDLNETILSGFVTKLKPAGKGRDDLVYSTFIGGNSSEPHARQGEKALGIAVGPTGSIYVTGTTCSKDFPVTSDAFQSLFAGPALANGGSNFCDAFIMKLNPAGQGQADLVYGSYFGGSSGDAAVAIALDGNGNVHLAGTTLSTDLPHTPDAFQTTFGGPQFGNDAFVAAIPIGNFSLDSVAPITADVGGSGKSFVTANATGEFNAPVTLSVSGAAGVNASFSPNSVTPFFGNPTSSLMTVSPGLATKPGTFTLNVAGRSGLLAHSTSTQLTVRASADGTGKVIDGITAAGCIDNSGISGALINKLTQAQRFIDAGQIQNAVNTLSALLNQLQAQSGKHISFTCTVDGQTFNPVDVLITDVRAILATLPGANAPNPIMGYVVNGSNVGTPGVTVSIMNTSNTATTDATGFYFFANTGSLSVGSSYSAKATGLPAGLKSSTPASQTFKWQGQAITFANFVPSKK